MAAGTESNGRKYVIVDKTDWCLSVIAQRHSTSTKKYTVAQLAAINNLKDPNLIRTGQKIYLDAAGGGGSSSATSSKPVNTKCCVITDFGVKANEDNTLYATWTWSKEADTASYKAVWTYSTEQGVEWMGKEDTISLDDKDKGLLPLYCQSTYQIPSNARIVWFKVKPIAIVDTKDDVDTPRFTDVDWSEKKKHYIGVTPPEVSGSISIKLTGLSLLVELKDVDLKSDGYGDSVSEVQFQIIRNNNYVQTATTVDIDKTYNYASYKCTVPNDGVYKARYRLIKVVDGFSYYSEWSGYSSEETSPPVAPASIKEVRAESESSVYIEWDSVATATGYEVAYTDKVTDFDRDPDGVSKKPVNSTNTYTEVKDLDTGKEYFFRVRAINQNASGDNQYSEWTDSASVKVGSVPEPPTIWSSATSIVVGEPLVLYWSHNCEDGSKWRYAQIRLFVNGEQITPDYTVENESADEDEDAIGSYSLDTTQYSLGTTIDWQVCTMGIINTFGEWSTPRTIDIHAQPTLDLSVTSSDGNSIDVLNLFPLYVRALAGPNTQAPLSFHLSVIANETYDTTDYLGNEKIVRAGDEVYSKHFDTTENPLMVELSAGNIDLRNNVGYTVVCTAAMNSGLTAEARKEFTVSWEEIGYSPTAAIGIDNENWTAQINPYCENVTQTYHKVSYAGGVYTVLDETVSGVAADIWIFDEETGQYYIDETANTSSIGTTITGEAVYEGVFPDGTTGYYCTVETREMIENVTLAVYRREFDGTFTEIAKGINNVKNSFVTDPHPSLDFARYRIVATTTNTGAVAYTDVPGQPVGCKSIVIQWDEEWSSFNVDVDEVLAQPPYTSSMLVLSYNVDVSDSNTPDVELVKYVGRKNPTTYYGTQIGQTATWNTTIPKTDKDTLYALRRLAVWMGDCYVREPSGSGYWANVKVTFNQKHKEVTIPVTFSITRVEGGM